MGTLRRPGVWLVRSAVAEKVGNKLERGAFWGGRERARCREMAQEDRIQGGIAQHANVQRPVKPTARATGCIRITNL